MRAFISIKYHADHTNRGLITQISSALERCGFETMCVIRDIEHWGTVQYSSEELMKRTFDAIDSSAFIIVDLTEKGVGIGIEAGYAYARGKPIITIALTASDISATLRGISAQVFTYTDPNELAGMFEQLRLGGI